MTQIVFPLRDVAYSETKQKSFHVLKMHPADFFSLRDEMLRLRIVIKSLSSSLLPMIKEKKLCITNSFSFRVLRKITSIHACELNNVRIRNIDRSIFIFPIFRSISVQYYATKMITLILIIGTIEDSLNRIVDQSYDPYFLHAPLNVIFNTM